MAKQQAGFSNVVRGDEELVRYQNKYEESMNPFEAFRGRVGPYALPLADRSELKLLPRCGVCARRNVAARSTTSIRLRRSS